jgi:oxygen-independent coproporphyrinogen-3 oxidase
MRDAQAIEGLYVHVPFCDGKCHYCAFYSVPYHRRLGDAWLEAVGLELTIAGRVHGPLKPRTLFLGGGTPTVLHPAVFRPLLDLLRTSGGGGGAQVEEWTVEANPGSLDEERLAMMREHGVNRISLGVQALDDAVLRRLGRRHGVADVEASVATIRSAGFANWSLDLIACIPGVGLDAWTRTVERACRWEPAHVSVYALTAEEGSRLWADTRSGRVALPSDEEQLGHLEAAESVLDRAGLRRYEISNFARPGRECRHNMACWEGRGYLGVGCAASSRVANRRWTHRADLGAYVKALSSGQLPPREEEELSPVTDAAERLVFGLRLMAGIDLEAILGASGTGGTDQAVRWRQTLARLQGEGLVWREGGRWRLTRQGARLADHVAVELLP